MSEELSNINSSDSIPERPLDDVNRCKALIKASSIAIGADLFLILLKYLLYVITGSAVLVADALHSGSDLAVSLTVMISIIVNYFFKTKTWAKKAEGFVALLISVVLIFGSIKILFGVLSPIAERFKLTVDIPLVIAILGISISCGIAFSLSRFKRRIGEQHNSIAFVAEAMHTRSDFFASFGVWITLVLGYLGIHIERFTTFIIGLIVLRIGSKLLIKAFGYFNIHEIFTIKTTEPLFEGPVRIIKSYWFAIVNYYNFISSKIKALGFLREEWVMARRKQLIGYDIGLIILLYLGTGFYSVLPYQTGVELFLGKVVELNPPGGHYHTPKPFGNVLRVDTGVAARAECGFRTNWAFTEEPNAYLWEFTHTQGRYYKVIDEAIAFTGDENLVDANFICYYRIVNPVEYALYNENTHELIRSMFCYEVHAVLGHYLLDTLLTSGRGLVQNELYYNMKQVTEDMPLGVEILNVYMQETHPPIQVVPSYRAVASARERKVEIVHRAIEYANNLLPHSRGESDSTVSKAYGYATEKTHLSKGESEKFLLTQSNFRRYDTVQEERMKWEALEKALKGKTIYILPKEAQHRVLTSDEITEINK
jgi:membrane protease subunit HflK